MKTIFSTLIAAFVAIWIFAGCAQQLVGTPSYNLGHMTEEDYQQLVSEKEKTGYTGVIINNYQDRTVLLELPYHLLKQKGYLPTTSMLPPMTELEIVANACRPAGFSSEGWVIKYKYVYTNGRTTGWKSYTLIIDPLPGTLEQNLPPRYQGRYDWYLLFDQNKHGYHH